jgi:hypothetical protein
MDFGGRLGSIWSQIQNALSHPGKCATIVHAVLRQGSQTLPSPITCHASSTRNLEKEPFAVAYHLVLFSSRHSHGAIWPVPGISIPLNLWIGLKAHKSQNRHERLDPLALGGGNFETIGAINVPDTPRPRTWPSAFLSRT